MTDYGEEAWWAAERAASATGSCRCGGELTEQDCGEAMTTVACESCGACLGSGEECQGCDHSTGEASDG